MNKYEQTCFPSYTPAALRLLRMDMNNKNRDLMFVKICWDFYGSVRAVKAYYNNISYFPSLLFSKKYDPKAFCCIWTNLKKSNKLPLP